MRHHLAKALHRVAAWVSSKSTPAPPISTGSTYDTYRRRREPTPPELVRELRNAAYACATINAAVCASFPPRLYVAVGAGLAPPKCPTRPIPRQQAKALAIRMKAEQVEEVTDHPMLRLIAHPNSCHSGYDLLELTTLYLECRGLAYWYLETDAFDVPTALWPLPSHLVTPKRAPDSPRMVDFFEYHAGRETKRFAPDEIVSFRYPDPRDPYTGGLSPLRAAFDHITLDGTFLAFKQAVWDNAGMPGAVISPKDAISPAERDRLEEDWNRKFRRGGQGKALIAEEGLDVKLLEQSLGDLATLAEQAATKEAIANAFGVPLSYLTATTNLANLEAADSQHAIIAIRPRLRRRDQQLNQQIVPLFDPTGRLILESDDPAIAYEEFRLRQEDQDVRHGIMTINELRNNRGLEPVPWGNEPWLPLQHAPPSFERRQETTYAPQVGRAKPENSTSNNLENPMA